MQAACNRLSDFDAEKFAIYAHCQQCGRFERIKRQAVERKYGPKLPLDDLRARLRCSKCLSCAVGIRIVYSC